jgi:hypothetical protein
MYYTGIKKSRSMPLLPTLKKKMAYHKLKKGRPISKFTKVTKKELKEKRYLITEAKKLMALTTPCADNAASHHLTLDEVFEDILYDSDEYTEYKENVALKALHDVINKTKMYTNIPEDFPVDNCEMPKSNIEKNEKGCSPIHMHLLDNELETESKVTCTDTASDTSDTDYKEALKQEDENEIFRMDEELDIIENDFHFIN